MTGFLLGAVLAVGLVAIAEGYAIFGRMQLFLTAAEQILAALQVPLRQVPSKSAGRTVAAAGIRPRPWFQVLRRLAELTQPMPVADEATGADDAVEDQVDDELGRWEDDGGHTPPEQDDEQPPAAHGPATEPTPRIDIAGGLRLPDPDNPPAPLLDDVDPWRAQFTFNQEGRRR